MENITARVFRKLKLSGIYQQVETTFFPTEFEKRYGHHNEFLLDLRGIKVKYSTKDHYSKQWFYPRYDHGQYHEPVITNIFIDEIKPGDCVLDVGAHLGYFTCLAGVLSKGGPVHAFEMDEQCFPLLERNAELNRLQNIFFNNFAVSDNNNFEMIPKQHQPSPGLKLAADNGTHYKKVKATTVDAYLLAHNAIPDFVKIDVEGAEHKVLKGMKETLKLPKLKMLVEVHPGKLRALRSHYKEVIKLLLESGFKLKEIVEHRSEDTVYRNIDGTSEINGDTMIFATKEMEG